MSISTIRLQGLRDSFDPLIVPVKARLLDAALAIKSGQGRFAAYDAMKAIYEAYLVLKLDRTRKKTARVLATTFQITRRKNTGLMRILIETAMPDCDAKQKSRWSRALEHVAAKHVAAKNFHKFVSSRGGLAGCAHLVTKHDRRKMRGPGEGDWAADYSVREVDWA